MHGGNIGNIGNMYLVQLKLVIFSTSVNIQNKCSLLLTGFEK